MKRFLGFFTAQLSGRRLLGRALALVSVLGFIGLIFVCGAASMFFQLPPSDFLNNAFTGARAWQERGRSTIPLLPSNADVHSGVSVDKPEKTSDGFTLFTLTDGARAQLVDMRGTVVHQWELPFSRAWTHAPHVEDPLADEQIHWFRCFLYPNGDLLAVYHADGDTPYGYGLVKLNKDSKLLWGFAGRVHHDVDVGDDGRIYTLTQKLATTTPAGLDFLPTPFIAEDLVVLSADGRELERVPLLEAFANSPYALVLTELKLPAPSASANGEKDPLHSNSVKVLSRALAGKFPLFKAGQVLVSLRNLNAIAVVDIATRRVAWAAQGVWRKQHDAELLDNGHLLIYDNYGSPEQTRILEYDPNTQAIPWSYANENSTPFRVLFRGANQRLPNGNTLIVDPDHRRLFEVSPEKEVVWEIVCPLPPPSANMPARGHGANSARRYGAAELTFLPASIRARP